MPLRLRYRGFYGGRNCLGDLVLNSENIDQIAVVSFSPQMVAGNDLDELGRDANAVPRTTHTAFQHIANAEFMCDPLHVNCTALVGKAGVAERLAARQRRNDVFGDAVSKVLLFRVAAHVLER